MLEKKVLRRVAWHRMATNLFILKKKPHFWIVIKQRAIQWGMSVSELNFLPFFKFLNTDWSPLL